MEDIIKVIFIMIKKVDMVNNIMKIIFIMLVIFKMILGMDWVNCIVSVKLYFKVIGLIILLQILLGGEFNLLFKKDRVSFSKILLMLENYKDIRVISAK